MYLIFTSPAPEGITPQNGDLFKFEVIQNYSSLNSGWAIPNISITYKMVLICWIAILKQQATTEITVSEVKMPNNAG